MRCLRCRVTGRVQGVFFRATAREEAQRLGITGYARNLPDGSVEVLACGPEEALAAFRDWLRRGPPTAQVHEVRCEEAPVTPPAQFRIR
ncbi:acylphosphatase [Inmirania thermothiophila]|uniref:Acylphosphatase n=1 Tax=Inmirania thermothiophila TaxID=1750597 RepID=A0A3N1Y958_9GAMM|nr:acylphosphatase [Inmirania thermothiophila]ROR35081.1 acylphosphatase [Inmirania thermothiophila]